MKITIPEPKTATTSDTLSVEAEELIIETPRGFFRMHDFGRDGVAIEGAVAVRAVGSKFLTVEATS